MAYCNEIKLTAVKRWYPFPTDYPRSVCVELVNLAFTFFSNVGQESHEHPDDVLDSWKTTSQLITSTMLTERT